MLTSFARLKKQLKDNFNSQVENNQLHDNQEARCITPTNQQRNVAKDKYASGDRGIVTTSTDQDGLIRYGTVQKQEQSPDITTVVDEMTSQLTKVKKKELPYCECINAQFGTCTHYHINNGIDDAYLEKMDQYITRLARSSEKIKTLMKEKQSSEKKCQKLKSKLKQLKQKVDVMCEDKFETTLRNHKLELRLKQAQLILQDEVDLKYGKNDITPLISSKSLQQLEAAKLTNLKNKEINPKSNYAKALLQDVVINA